MSFDPFSIDLPIRDCITDLREKLSFGTTAIVHAPPGAGKSTLLPLALIEEVFLSGQKIIMLEPRRLAAKSIAMRLSELWGEEVGKTIGYRVRFEQRVSANTRIEVVTEGILTRMLQSDASLEGIGMVIFDEFHERSLHADLALALCREAQQVLRQDLRLLIMSATLNLGELSELLQAPVVSSEGRQYPVKVHFGDGVDPYVISEIMTRKILEALKKEEGDILAFFPGEAEIKRCEEELKRLAKGVEIHPLYGMLPPGKQMAAIRPSKQGRRKIVLATSIAETSLTIEGVNIVVDSGLGRKQRFDPRSGLSRLETIRISRDSAEQRAGRAGRLGPGVCYRLWTFADHEQMQQHDSPEIMDADLCSLVLELANWGVKDASALIWLNPPPISSVASAKSTLEEVQALENGRITEHGKRMLELPCHPRIAHMLILASDKQLACDLAAVLEERDPLPRDSGIDINLRIEALRRFRTSPNASGGRFSRIDKIAHSYLKIFNLDSSTAPVDPFETGLLVAYAFPERIAASRPGNNAQYQLANGRYAQAGHKDDLAHEPWLAVAHVDARDGLGKIFMAAPLNPKDLAPLVKEKEIITWDTRKGGLIASKDLRIGSIVLRSTPLPSPSEEHLQQAILKAIATEGKNLLNWDEEVANWQNRVLSLRKWNPGESWPEVSTDNLLLRTEDWIAPYLNGIKKPEDLKKLNLKEILNSSLSWEQQVALKELAPEKLEVPSGSQIHLRYQANGNPPILSVRLQQTFGWADTPKVNGGKIAVIMELLSPANRPVQTTSDLKNFWDSTYFEVKKELKRRYPKHYWPEDPWNAEARKGTKR